jgi:hypothetical protein
MKNPRIWGASIHDASVSGEKTNTEADWTLRPKPTSNAPRSTQSFSATTAPYLAPRCPCTTGTTPASLPAPEDTERLLLFLQDQPSWSAFWDKAHGLWRAAEDDPHSSLYIESRDVETVIGYIVANA